MSLMARVWMRVSSVSEQVADEPGPQCGFPLAPPTFFAETGQQAADAERLVAMSLAELTAKLGDPWAAAVEMFGGRS